MYEIYLKAVTQKLDDKHKHYKQLFEQVKKREKLHFDYTSNLITKYRNNIAMKWSVTREAIEEKSLAGIYF